MYDQITIMVLIALGISLVCSVIAQFFLFSTLRSSSSLLRPNYRGEEIPVGAGFIFIIGSLPGNALLSILPGQSITMWLTWISGTLLCALLGCLDDIAGNREDSGLRGHLKALIKEKRLTTGGLKAAGGLILAIYISLIFTQNPWEILLWVISIALSINVINIFDLRPGRAIKFYLFMVALLFALAGFVLNLLVYLGPLLLAVLVYFPLDVKAKAMMGDTGANALGLSLGLSAVWFLDWGMLLGYTAILIVLHIVAEKTSITKIIAKYSLLQKIDDLGR